MIRIENYVINLKEIRYLLFNEINKELIVCFINGTILNIEEVNEKTYEEICYELYYTKI